MANKKQAPKAKKDPKAAKAKPAPKQPSVAPVDPKHMKDAKKYVVGFARRPFIVTEIKRPDPDAVLVLTPGETVELTGEEIRVLLHGEQGALIPLDLLTPVGEQDADKGGEGLEGAQEGQSAE